MSRLLYADLTYQIIGAAMEVHQVLGGGYLEQVYEGALAHELSLLGLQVERQRKLPVQYKGVEVGFYIADLVVEEKVIIEVKAINNLNKANEAQLINYITTTGFRVGLLLNFGNRSLQHKRMVK